MKTPVSLIIVLIAAISYITSFAAVNNTVNCNNQDNERSTTTSDTQNYQLNLNGYARASAWGGSKSYRLNTLFAEIGLQGEYQQGNAFIKTDLRLRKGNSFGNVYQLIDVNNLYVGFTSQSFDIQLGYLYVEWGRADGFNPTNYLQTYDYFYLTADPADQKVPNLTMRTRLRIFQFGEIDLAIMPYYLPSVYRYELFELGNNVRFTNPILPSATWRNGSIAGRANFDFPGLGFSVSAFRGFDPFHGFNVLSVDWASGTPQLINQAASYQKTSLGVDFSVTAGPLVLKAEAAWNDTKRPGNEMYIPHSYWMYVAGTEAAIGSSTLVLNYSGYLTPEFETLVLPQPGDPMNQQQQLAFASAMIDYENRQFNRRIFHQYKKSNHALSLSWFRKFAYDEVEAQVSLYYDFTSDDLMARPSLKWSVSDYLSINIGAQYMYGAGKTLFSYSSTLMNGAFAELRVHF